MELTINDFLEGDKVYFGRENGQRTLGIIHKKNPKKAKVKLLEQRGHGRGSEIGSIGGVPYNMLEHAADTFVMNRGGVEQRLDFRQPEVLKYNQFDQDNGVLMEILNCYSNLSPESLTCDGEASASHIRAKSAQLNRKLKYLQLAIDKQVSEDQAWQWLRSKDEYEAQQKSRFSEVLK